MVRHPPLGEIVGADLLRAVPGSDLAAPLLGLRALPFRQLHIVEFGAEQAKCLLFILQLGFLRLAVDDDSRGNVGQAHGGVCGVYALAAVSGSAHHIDAAVVHVDLYVHILGLRHHRHRRCGGVNPPAGLRLRHPLHPVHAALVLQLGVGSLSVDHADHFLEAADAVLADAHHLHLPVLVLRVVHIHAVKLRRKQSRLVAAGAGADLQDNVLVIVGVLGEKKNLQLLFQILDPLPGIRQFLLGQLPHLLIGLLLQEKQAVLHVLLGLLILLIGVHQRRQIRLLFHQFAETVLILRHRRIV